MSIWGAPSIRTRLTAWYAGVLALMLLIYAGVTYLAVRHEFVEQLDDELHHDFEVAEERLIRTPDGRIVWTGEDHHDPEDDNDRAYDVWSAAGEQIHRSGAAVSMPPVALAAIGSSFHYETVAVSDLPWRTLTGPISVAGHAVVLRVSRSQEALARQLAEVLLVLVLGIPLVVVLAGVGGYALARRALAPIDHLGSEARRITADRLHEQLSVRNPHDEVGRLAAVINDTLARLHGSFSQLRRFTSDASHELRTPLAVVRGIGEAAVAERRTPAEYEEAIGSMLEEVDRLTGLVDSLLRLSRADAGAVQASREAVDLGQLAAEVGASLAVLAEERNQRLTMTDAGGVIVLADRLILREAITNLLDNAIKYTPNGSSVEVRTERAAGESVLMIADRGPGIRPEHREQIFDRFFRVDEGRSRDAGGVGLGLAIAKWAVEINGGRISVGDRSGGGAEFRITLPHDETK